MNLDDLRILAGPVLVRNRTEYERAVDEITNGLERRNPVTSAALVQVAAEFAWRNHPGVFSSTTLESALRQLASAGVAASEPAAQDKRLREARGTRARKVLHVLSEAYDIGGHTRLVSRWIRWDQDSQHSVAVLRHPGGSLPGFLRDAVSQSEGACYRVDQRPTSLLGRAKALGRISQEYDYMAVHTHPFDAVSALSAGWKGPAVMKVDSADHVFSIGMGKVDAILHTRRSAAELARLRRGVDHSRGFVLPIPLDPAIRTSNRAEAKRQLGVPVDDVLMLSIGSPYKFSPYADLDFIGTHVEFLNQNRQPRARLIVLGPDPSGLWKLAEERTHGLFRALGYVHDPGLYLQAADIAVESFPVGSITAVLEAASYGNPVVSLRYATTPEAQIYRTDDPGLEGLILLPDRESYCAVLDELVTNSARRREIGDEIGKGIVRLHCGKGWRAVLEDAYSFASSRQPGTLADTAWRDDEIDLLTAGFHESSGFSRSMYDIRRSHIGAFALADRIRALGSESFSISTAKGLLPDWLRGLLSRLVRGA